MEVVLRNMCRKAVDLVYEADRNVLGKLIVDVTLRKWYRKAVNFVWNSDETVLKLGVVM